MKLYPPMESGQHTCETDHGPSPFVANIVRAASENQNFRTAFWTGQHVQMTLMSIPPYGEIGAEMHPDTDQIIRVEEGAALLRMGTTQEDPASLHHLYPGDAVFVPHGTWHNLENVGSHPLKLSSIYAPPQHPKCTVHHTKEDAANESHQAH